MIDHSKGLRNFKKHIYRQKASGAFCSDYKDICRQRRVDVYSGTLDATPTLSRDPVTGHCYPLNVEQAQDSGSCFRWAMIKRRLKNLGFFRRSQIPATNLPALEHASA